MKLLKKKSRKYNFRLIENIAPILIFVALILLIFSFLFVLREKVFKQSTSRFSAAEEIDVDYDFLADVYFNDYLGGEIFSEEIIKAVNESKSKIEVAIYAMNDLRLVEALNGAAERGVDISLILSDKRKDTHDVIFKDLSKKVKRLDVPHYALPEVDKSYLMHHKFIIIDRDTEDEILFFGSYNFTYFQEKYDPSFLLKTGDKYLIKIFGQEFERINNGIHGWKKIEEGVNPFAAKINYHNGFIEVWFSPGNVKVNIRDRMIELMRKSKESIKIIIWFWTDKKLAGEMLAVSQERNTKIITDDFNFFSKDSVFNDILKKDSNDNLEIITDENRREDMIALDKDGLNSFLHQHTMILDDSIVLAGTNNWSTAGFLSNDESIIISDIPFLVQAFKDSFDVNYSKNK